MSARCKPGDLAIIINEVPQCTANIGRIVNIGGPSACDQNGRLTWLIKPVTSEPYLISTWCDESVRCMTSEDDDIEQPDEWLLPIRPENNEVEEECRVVEEVWI